MRMGAGYLRVLIPYKSERTGRQPGEEQGLGRVDHLRQHRLNRGARLRKTEHDVGQMLPVVADPAIGNIVIPDPSGLLRAEQTFGTRPVAAQ